jgi:phosphoglycolate phosphatase-like HAD superfamily hydrolase
VARILLFDIDFTLTRTKGAGRAAMELAFAEEFGVRDATAGISFDGRTDYGIYIEVIARHGIAGDRDAIFARATAAYLRAIHASLAEHEGEVLPGVPGLLEALARAEFRPGLATGNIRLGAKAKLTHFGLWESFCGGGFGDSSPIRADLVHAGIGEVAAVLGIAASPADCIVLGDTPLDIEGAHAAGARAVGVATGRYTVAELKQSGADWALDDLSDTATVLDILRS